MKIITRDFNAALVLICLFSVGTVFEVVPSQIVVDDENQMLKEIARANKI